MVIGEIDCKVNSSDVKKSFRLNDAAKAAEKEAEDKKKYPGFFKYKKQNNIQSIYFAALFVITCSVVAFL